MARQTVKMRHPKLGVERDMPVAAVRHWQKVGWQVVKPPSPKKKDPEQEGES